MSVINKMLKDLEQRQEPELHRNGAGQPASFQAQTSNRQSKLIILLSSLVVVLLAAIVWLFLRKPTSVELSQPIQSVTSTPIKVAPSATQPAGAIPELVVDEDQERQLQLALATEPEKTAQVAPAGINSKKSELPGGSQAPTELPLSTDKPQAFEKTTKDAADAKPPTIVMPGVNEPPKPLNPKSSEQVVVATTSAPAVSSKPVPPVTSSNEPPSQEQQPLATSLSIEKTSTVLTKAERINNLMVKAQKSFDQGYITEAISQLKEVLAADDSHVDARNLLAVAWYGRGENQMAVSILNDGLGRYPAVEKWRLTAAKMFFKQNNPAGAFSYLEADLTSAGVEYHTMKGTLARQLQRFDKAESAYLMLTQLQPEVGNWWLGYAIALDIQDKTQMALHSYKMVIDKGGVSAASLDFAQQRIQELKG